MATAAASIALFAALPPALQQEISAALGEHTHAPGSLILLEGEPATQLCFVLAGVVRVRQTSSDGRDYVVSHLRAGACCNLVVALDGSANPFSVDALSAVRLAVIPRERFAALLRAQPTLALAVAGQLATEVRQLHGQIERLALHNVRARLAHFLLNHAESAAPQHLWTQEAIASHIGTVRDVVGRTLRAFAEEGLLQREKGRLVVTDRAALERVASEG
jgi:CRP/FNR family transcriptional regulator